MSTNEIEVQVAVKAKQTSRWQLNPALMISLENSIWTLKLTWWTRPGSANLRMLARARRAAHLWRLCGIGAASCADNGRDQVIGQCYCCTARSGCRGGAGGAGGGRRGRAATESQPTARIHLNWGRLFLWSRSFLRSISPQLASCLIKLGLRCFFSSLLFFSTLWWSGSDAIVRVLN